MLTVEKQVLQKAIKLLDSIKVPYAIVTTEKTYGELKVETAKKKKRGVNSYAHKYGRGVLRGYVRPYLEKLREGDIAVIPAGDFDLPAIALSASSYAHQIFGKGAWTGAQNTKDNTFEVMRLGA